MLDEKNVSPSTILSHRSMQGEKVVEAHATLLFHLNKIDNELRAIDPAYSRPRHTYGRLMSGKGEAQLDSVSHFD
jgi:hypothetical protein